MIISVVILIVLGIAVTIYGVYLYYNNRKKFNNFKPLIEFIGTFLTILLALVTIYQTNSSIEGSTTDFNRLIGRVEDIIGNVSQVKDTLGSVSNKLTSLPNQIDTFSASINALNSVTNLQKENLGKTLNDLNYSLDKFQKALDAVIEKMNQKPDLKILYKELPLQGQKVLIQSPDDSPYIPPIMLYNKGTKEVNFPSINIFSSVPLGLHGSRYAEGRWADGRDKRDKYPYHYLFEIFNGTANDLAVLYPNEKDEIPYIRVNVFDKSKPISCLLEIYYAAEAPITAAFEVIFK